MRKKKPIIVKWNGKKVSVKIKGYDFTVTPLEGQTLSQNEKYQIIKLVVLHG